MNERKRTTRSVIDGYKLIERITGVRCGKCADFIWSIQRHDFHCCKCGYTFVDGGRDYLRYGAGIGKETRKKATTIMPSVETYDVLINTKTGEQMFLPVDKEED